MSTPSIPGVDRAALADTIAKDQKINLWSAHTVADAALAHIAAHHECACDREHDDEWVEVDEATWLDLPGGARTRRDWVRGVSDVGLFFVRRDDLPDPDTELIERMTKAIFASNYPNTRWEGLGEDTQEHYRKAARAALAAYRKGER